MLTVFSEVIATCERHLPMKITGALVADCAFRRVHPCQVHDITARVAVFLCTLPLIVRVSQLILKTIADSDSVIIGHALPA